MHKIFKAFLLILFFVLFTSAFSEAQVSIKFTLKNSDFKQAYLCGIMGVKLNVIGAKKFKGNTVEFKYSVLSKGMYRILMADSAFVDFVVDRDPEITLETSYPKLTDSLKVLKGEDNRVYYEYLHFKNAQIGLLNQVLKNIKPDANKKSNALAEERASFLKGCITYRLQQYTDSLVGRDSALYVSKLIRAQIIPNLSLWMLKHPTSIAYNNDIEFMFSHFFDNIDFSDSLLIHTEFLYRTINYYIEKIALPRNVTGFNIANDMMLKKAAANKSVYNYVLSTLIDMYEKTQLEEVFEKLFDDYLVKDSVIASPVKYADLKGKIKIIKSLKKGMPAPDISGRDTTGREFKLSSVKSTVTLLILWTSYGKNSDETIEQMNDIYKKYKDYGLRIFGVSLDSNETKWKASLRKLKPEWTNVIDTSGLKGSVSKLYNTWALPGLYIMDLKHDIAAKPMNADYVKKEFESAFKK